MNKKNKHRVYRPPTKKGTGCWCTTVDYPPGHALPAMTHTSGRTRSYCGWTPYHRAVFSPSRGDPGVRRSTPEALP